MAVDNYSKGNIDQRQDNLLRPVAELFSLGVSVYCAGDAKIIHFYCAYLY